MLSLSIVLTVLSMYFIGVSGLPVIIPVINNWNGMEYSNTKAEGNFRQLGEACPRPTPWLFFKFAYVHLYYTKQSKKH